MADIKIDYDEIRSAATRMGTKLTDISNELDNLQTQVANLLHDGLVFEKASPALQEAYRTFNEQMKNSASNIHAYAKNFTDIADSLNTSDTKLMGDINTAIAKMKADAAAHK
ncbi:MULTISPECIES: WXG100 family type VII secretion target [unclassified Embleya]|uniref:WXG100 family type VII secretion target n=1 Tax=unclassified Embleya TaxID=2699296 RepID=UPI003410112F